MKKILLVIIALALLACIPPGIRPEEHDAGTWSTLEKLARFAEARSR